MQNIHVIKVNHAGDTLIDLYHRTHNTQSDHMYTACIISVTNMNIINCNCGEVVDMIFYIRGVEYLLQSHGTAPVNILAQSQNPYIADRLNY